MGKKNLFLIFLLLVGSTSQAQQQRPITQGFSYEYSTWYDAQTIDDLKCGNYDRFLSQFDFVHDALPAGGNKDWSWNGFFLGNGQVGMIVDYLGSQAAPYHTYDNNIYWGSDLDSLTTVTRSPEFKSEWWDAYKNTSPSISANESYVREKTPSGHGNYYRRGTLGIRLAAFPLIDGVFDVGKIDDYHQRLILADNQCVTTFVYDGRIKVKTTAFTSWSDNRMVVYNVELTNLMNCDTNVGFVADPIVGFTKNLLQFAPYQGVLAGSIARTDEGLYFDHHFVLGALKEDNPFAPIDGRYKDITVLKPGKTVSYSAFFGIYCSTDEHVILDTACRDIARIMSGGYENASQSHRAEVQAFWKRFHVLLPWKELCKVYYRNILISVDNLRHSKYHAQVSMMTNSSYRGLSWGMDDIPVIELLLQLGRTDYLSNLADFFYTSMPSDPDNSGHTLNYDYDQFPWRSSILCNTSGNILWMLYQYYRMSGDEVYLREKLYPIMRTICNFYAGYGEEIEGVYGFWTRKQYQGRQWMLQSYDETVHKKTPDANYRWGEIDHPADLVGPAKLALQLSIQTAEKLGLDADLVTKWKSCNEQLRLPQNEEYYQLYIDRPDGKGLGKDDFPFCYIVDAAAFNVVYPTPLVVNDAKMERTYLALKDTTKSKFEWSFNYNHQLWGAVARMRLDNEMEWLLTKSEMRLDKAFHKDGMMICEGQDGSGAGYFFMPYAMISASVNEMLLQSYDGVIKVFPAVFPGFKDYPISFRGLHALDGFAVSGSQKSGRTSNIEIDSNLGKICRVELPYAWKGARITDANRRSVRFTTSSVKVRIKREEKTMQIIEFETVRGGKYVISQK